MVAKAHRQLFIPREKEMQVFRRMLGRRSDDACSLYLRGPGGMGKTWLLHAMLDEASKRSDIVVVDKLIDMYANDMRLEEDVTDVIVGKLRRTPSLPTIADYDRARDELRTALADKQFPALGREQKRLALTEAFHSCLKSIVQTGKRVMIVFDTFEHAYDTRMEPWLLGKHGLQVPGIIAVFAGRPPLKAEYAKKIRQIDLSKLTDQQAVELYVNYHPSIIPITKEVLALSKKLNRRADGNPLLIAMGSDANFTAGELDRIGENEFEQRIIQWLNPHNYEPSNEVPEQVRQALVWMAHLNRRFNSKFLEQLVNKKYVSSRSASSRPLAAPEIWEKINTDEYELYFIKDRPDDEVQLHDKFAELIQKHWFALRFDEELVEAKLLSLPDDRSSWYDELIRNAPSAAEKDALRAEKLAYVLNANIWIDPDREEGSETIDSEPASSRLRRALPVDFAKAQQLFEEYKSERSDTLNRLLLTEIKPAVIRKLDLDQQYQTYTFLGDLARRSYLHGKAQEYHRLAYEALNKNGTPLARVDALINLHNSTWRNNPQESLKLLKQALQICEQDNSVPNLVPRILYELGFTYRQLQNLDQAIEYYEQARAACREQKPRDLVRLATILNDLAFAYYFRGDHKPLSENYINLALKHRTQYLADLESDETASANDKAEAALRFGRTLNTSGEIFRYKNHVRTAVERYTEALTIFDKDKNYEWQVKALTGRGEASRRLAAQQKELFPEESAEHTRSAEQDFDRALDLCNRYAIANESDTAYRRKGRSLHDRAIALKETDRTAAQQLLQQARQHFERALKFARETNDDLEQLENLTEIIFLGDDEAELAAPAEQTRLQVNHKKAMNKLAAFIAQEPPVYQLPVFTNLLEMERGALAYISGDYKKALKHYLRAFTNLAADPGYGSTRYQAHLGHLKSRIEALPDRGIVEQWCAAFVKTWQQTSQKDSSLPLAEVHPDLVVWCEEYADLPMRG